MYKGKTLSFDACQKSSVTHCCIVVFALLKKCCVPSSAMNIINFLSTVNKWLYVEGPEFESYISAEQSGFSSHTQFKRRIFLLLRFSKTLSDLYILDPVVWTGSIVSIPQKNIFSKLQNPEKVC